MIPLEVEMTYRFGSITWKGFDRAELLVVSKTPNWIEKNILVSIEHCLRK